MDSWTKCKAMRCRRSRAWIDRLIVVEGVVATFVTLGYAFDMLTGLQWIATALALAVAFIAQSVLAQRAHDSHILNTEAYLLNTRIRLFSSEEAYLNSDFAEGASVGLRHKTLEVIRMHRKPINAPLITSGNCRIQSSVFHVNPGDSVVSVAYRMLESLGNQDFHYVVIALEDECFAQRVADTLQAEVDEQCLSEAPVVLGIQAPLLIRWSSMI